MTRPDPLSTFHALNVALMAMDEKQASALMERERAGLNRANMLRRILSRIQRLRALRERAEIG